MIQYSLELQLLDRSGKVLAERIHIFGAQEVKAPLAALMARRIPDADDNPADGQADIVRPVTRANLAVSASPVRRESNQEVLDLAVKNTGKMTALFCAPHPLIEYRTDLFHRQQPLLYSAGRNADHYDTFFR